MHTHQYATHRQRSSLQHMRDLEAPAIQEERCASPDRPDTETGSTSLPKEAGLLDVGGFIAVQTCDGGEPGRRGMLLGEAGADGRRGRRDKGECWGRG